jgi:hypothetical protein
MLVSTDLLGEEEGRADSKLRQSIEAGRSFFGRSSLFYISPSWSAAISL